MSLTDIWAVVVNWNGGQDNLRCVDSLLASGLEQERIVFVDNGSHDGSAASVADRFPRIVKLNNQHNLGFGAGANQGAREALSAGARAVVFVNNDVTFPPQTLSRLVAVLEDQPRVGLLGPRVLLPGTPARIWSAGGKIGSGPNLSRLLGHGRPDGERWQQVACVDYIPGCALLARREVLLEVGLFEEAYFAYLEDVELGVRAQEAGWQVWCVGDVACEHAPSSSTGGGYSARRKYMNGVNSVHFLRRHGTPGLWLTFAFWDVLLLPFVWLAGLPRGRGRAVAAKALGIWHGIRGRRVTARDLEPGGMPLW